MCIEDEKSHVANSSSNAKSSSFTTDEQELLEHEDDAHSLYKHCIEIRNFEITNLVARNNFFMIFQGVLIAGLLQSSGTAPPAVMFLATLCGFGISICQTLSSSGAKFWQKHWEDELRKTEANYEKRLSIARGEALAPKTAKKFYSLYGEKKRESKKFFGIIERYSVSRIPIYAGFVFSAFWLILSSLTLTYPNRYFHEIIESSISGFPKPKDEVKPPEPSGAREQKSENLHPPAEALK